MLRPWARGVFEIILHGELHYRAGEDFDRRMALISFDNAIEVAITTYLSLNPIQRQNRQYHEGSPSTPNLRDLKGIREAALWIFSELYDVPDSEQILEERVAALI